MADRKVYVDVTVRLIIRADEGVEISDVFDKMTYSFDDTTGKAEVEDATITNYNITDSK